MSTFNFQCEISLGWSHCGEVTTAGNGSVELTDEEVKTLVNLIRESGTTDVNQLQLSQKYPEIYGKLNNAYYAAAKRADALHWMWDGYNNGYYEYDEEEVMAYCEDHCGYAYEPEGWELPDELDLEEDEEQQETKLQHFREWLDDYLRMLPDEEAFDFFVNHLEAEVDMSDFTSDFEVCIPDAILQLAQEEK